MSLTLKDSIKRLLPVIKIKDAVLDKEMLKLSEIKEKKKQAVVELRSKQANYLTGINKLNDIRMSNDRAGLEFNEDGCNFLREEWYRVFKEVQNIDREEKKQTQLVLKIWRERKSFENLKIKYEGNLKVFEEKLEQKRLDELSTMRGHLGKRAQ